MIVLESYGIINDYCCGYGGILYIYNMIYFISCSSGDRLKLSYWKTITATVAVVYWWLFDK